MRWLCIPIFFYGLPLIAASSGIMPTIDTHVAEILLEDSFDRTTPQGTWIAYRRFPFGEIWCAAILMSHPDERPFRIEVAGAQGVVTDASLLRNIKGRARATAPVAASSCGPEK